MNPHRLKALEGLLDYLTGMQGGDLKALLDESKNPMEGDPSMSMDMDDAPEMEVGKPKGISIEKVELMKKPMGEESMMDEMEDNAPEIPEETEASDDELEELYKKFRG